MSGEKKKLLFIGIGIVGFAVLMIIILLIVHAVTAKKETYKGIENKVLAAAKRYYRDNPTLLPQHNGGEVSVEDSALTSAGYLKSMADLTKGLGGVTCSAKVIVTKNSDNFRYTPLLDCGEKYSSKTLYSYIMKNEERVYSGEGLYELNGEYVYRGENTNNHIKFSGKNYRIVKFTDGKAMLILDEKLERISWDDRYNIDRENNDGINDYSVSRAREYLDELYKGNKFISNDNKSLLSNYTLYIGKRDESDNYNDGSIEKSTIIENQYIGLLPLYDYINASLDVNCASALTNSCANYNYLNKFGYNFWTMTASANRSHKVYRVYSEGDIEAIRAAGTGYVRPVIYLVSDALYVSGDGSEDNPYIIK